MDYAAIADAADWSSLLIPMGAVGAAIALALVARKGVRLLLGLVK